MAYPPVIVVDEQDRPTGLAMLAEAWQKGLFRRMVRIMVEDGKGNVLLQKRNPHMVIFPNCWDNSAAGHVDEGMTYHTAALQEVAEELGVNYQGLAEIGYFVSRDTYQGKIMNEFNKVYRVKFQGMPRTADHHEVAEFRWFSIAEAKQLAMQQPELVTLGLYHVLERLYKV
jgi:isopentenyl-diphosphate delta-isomerase